jgi:hypothetical protein
MPYVAPNSEDVFSLLGFALTSAQSVERMLRLCTTYVVPKKGGWTFEKLQSLKEEERLKTLGYFVDQVRRRTSLKPDFSDTLSKYLDMRNDIVHDHRRISGWDLECEEGVTFAKQHLWEFIELGTQISNLFAALAMEWQQLNGIDVKLDEQARSHLDVVKSQYGHLVFESFFSSEKPAT